MGCWASMKASAAAYGVLAWLSIMVIMAHTAGLAPKVAAIYALKFLIGGLPAFIAVDLLISGIRAATSKLCRAAAPTEGGE